jgi:hypothetical protein
MLNHSERDKRKALYGGVLAVLLVAMIYMLGSLRAEGQPPPFDPCAGVTYPEDHPGNIFHLPFDHLTWFEDGPGLACLAPHNTSVVVWWASWYDKGEEARVEIPWGERPYRFRPAEEVRILGGIHALRSVGVKSLMYVHTWNLKKEGYSIAQIAEWALYHKTWWGIEGIYLDGVFYGDELETQRLFEALRGVFPRGEGIIYLHDSNSSRSQLGHPRAIELVDYCLVGEWKTDPWTDEELAYKLKDPGPSRSFTLKIHNNPNTPGDDVTKEERKRLICWCARNNVSIRWPKGWLFKDVRWYEECLPGGD